MPTQSVSIAIGWAISQGTADQDVDPDPVHSTVIVADTHAQDHLGTGAMTETETTEEDPLIAIVVTAVTDTIVEIVSTVIAEITTNAMIAAVIVQIVVEIVQTVVVIVQTVVVIVQIVVVIVQIVKMVIGMSGELNTMIGGLEAEVLIEIEEEEIAQDATEVLKAMLKGDQEVNTFHPSFEISINQSFFVNPI